MRVLFGLMELIFYILLETALSAVRLNQKNVKQGDNSLWVLHCEQLLSYQASIFNVRILIRTAFTKNLVFYVAGSPCNSYLTDALDSIAAVFFC